MDEQIMCVATSFKPKNNEDILTDYITSVGRVS